MLEGQVLKQEGLALVENNNKAWVDAARSEARRIAMAYGSVNSDEIHQWANRIDWHPKHHNCYGSVFRGDEWHAVGVMQSRRPSGHARLIRVWRLRNGNL